MKKKILAAILAAALLVSMVACSDADSESSETSSGDSQSSTAEGGDSSVDTSMYPGITDMEKEALELGLINLDGTLPIIPDPAAFEEKYGKISMHFVTEASRVVETSELEMVKKWEADTGVSFDWTTIPGEGAVEKINLLLTSGNELPDAFWNFAGGLSGNIVVQFSDQELFIPTENLINNYMPTLKGILDENPKYWQEITAPDGHTYGFPYIEEMYGLVLTPGPWLINQDWLDQVGVAMPTTVDEYVDALIAIRDGGDLNGNGVDDEIPMAVWFGANDTFGSYNLFYRFTGAFGMSDSYCGGNPYADHLAIVDGAVTFTALDDAFRQTAELFNEMYNEDLIWTGSFEADASAAFQSSLIKEDVARIGSFGVWTDQEISNLDVHAQYEALPRLTGENGSTGNHLNFSELQDSSNTAITVDADFPTVIAAFVEYMVADPVISITSNWGAEGYNYIEDAEGILRTPLDENGNIIAVEPYTSFGEMRSNTTTARGSMVVLNEYYETVAGYAYDAVQLLENQRTNGKDAVMEEITTIPKVLMTQDEVSRLAQIQPPISDVVDRYITDWVINGVTDESWDMYKSDLAAAGVDELVSLYQAAIDRASE